MATMGRPKSDSPKMKSVGIRLTEEEYEKLRKYAADRNLTITEALQKGIMLLMKEP